jgi:vitamin B12 transporter
MVNYRLALFFLLLGLYGFGQDTNKVVSLNEYTVSAEREGYLVGTKVERFDSTKMEAASAGSLSEALTRYTPIYIKQDAGGLATIRFRGTSAEHTAILFSGININSMTLGHSNLSNIPMFLFNDVSVQFGSSGAVLGSDAIGGSIHINSKPEWNKGFFGSFQQDIGSFNSLFTGAKAGYSTKRFSFILKAYHQERKNDFPFLNTLVKDFEKNEFVRDTNRNSQQRNSGFFNEISYLFSKKLTGYIKTWYEDDFHQVQSNMSANYFGGSFDQIQDNHLRMITGLKYFNGDHQLTGDFGYVKDQQIFNKNMNEVISMQSMTGTVNYFNTNLLKGSFNSGFNLNYIVPDVYAYQDNLNEYRLDMYASYSRKIGKILTGVVNIRETMVSNYKTHFTPSVGLKMTAISKKEHTLNLRMTAGHSYKIPTFNQRYWYPNGNPDILPESSMNYEIGSDYSWKRPKFGLSLNTSIYYMEVDNWIQWVNIDIWRPINIKNVENYGLESAFENYLIIGKWTLKYGLNYSYTHAKEVKSYINMPSNGKQLIYTPMHNGNLFFSTSFLNYSLLFSSSYTGSRYTESYKELESYTLCNIGLEKKIKFKKHAMSLSASVNNLFDKAYQNQEWYAMPGRNWVASLKYSFN